MSIIKQSYSIDDYQISEELVRYYLTFIRNFENGTYDEYERRINENFIFESQVVRGKIEAIKVNSINE